MPADILSDRRDYAEPGDAALFIDWENFKYSLYELGKIPQIAALMRAVEERYGRPVVARAYADWEDYYHRKSFDQMNLYYAGVEPVYVPSRRNTMSQSRIKNSVDVKMSMDCMEISFSNKHIKTFVLVTGDADFLHIATSLRSRGNRVIMVGVTGSTSQRLNAVVDELVFYDVDIEEPVPIEGPPVAEPEKPLALPVVVAMPAPPIQPAPATLPLAVPRPAPIEPPKPLEELTPEEQQFIDIVNTADDIERSHRDYMAKSLLARFLFNKGHWNPADLPARAAPALSESWQTMEMPDILPLIEKCVEKGYLRRTLYRDPYTDAEIPSLELNRDHPFVRSALMTFPLS